VGMDDYLAKPFTMKQMKAMLVTWLERSSGVSDGQPSLIPAAEADPIDRQALLVRVGGDQQLLNEVVQLFLADCPIRIAELQAAVDARDARGIRSAAHALKGSAGNLSATGLASAARTLERIGAEGRIEAAPAALRQLAVEAALAMDALRQDLPGPVPAG